MRLTRLLRARVRTIAVPEEAVAGQLGDEGRQPRKLFHVPVTTADQRAGGDDGHHGKAGQTGRIAVSSCHEANEGNDDPAQGIAPVEADLRCSSLVSS
jgi:hypothetical protein